jgi:hypothetical protein
LTPDLFCPPVPELAQTGQPTIQDLAVRRHAKADDVHGDAQPGHRNFHPGHKLKPKLARRRARLLQSLQGVVIGQGHDLDTRGMRTPHQLRR